MFHLHAWNCMRAKSALSSEHASDDSEVFLPHSLGPGSIVGRVNRHGEVFDSCCVKCGLVKIVPTTLATKLF